MMRTLEIYLAGGLFNAGERFHNLQLEGHLTKLGWRVLLPQREALKHRQAGKFDVPAIARECRDVASDPNTIVVACADGPDADSGTCVELGIAIQSKGSAIVYRTDFRTSFEDEVGVNAMLMVEGARFIYSPCFDTELNHLDQYYSGLAKKIDTIALKLQGQMIDSS